MNYDQFNENIKTWGKDLVIDAKRNGAAQGIQHVPRSPSKSASLPKVKDKYAFKTGVVNKVSITFPRSLIYTMKGAGNGIGGRKGSRWVNAKGESKKTNPDSLNKVGTGNRRQKDFINQSLDGGAGVEKLADIAALSLSTVVTENLFIN